MALFLHIFFKKMNSWFFFKKRFYLLNLNFLSENAYFAQNYIGEIFFLMKMHIFLTFIKHKIKNGHIFACVLCLLHIFLEKFLFCLILTSLSENAYFAYNYLVDILFFDENAYFLNFYKT